MPQNLYIKQTFVKIIFNNLLCKMTSHLEIKKSATKDVFEFS